MVRLSMIWAAILGAAQIAARDATRLWTRMVMFALILIALVIVQWLINVFVTPELNFVFVFAGTALLLLLGLSPAGFAIGAGVGTVFAALKDNDLTQGSYQGLVLTYRVTISIVFWWVIISGAIATWPLAKDPMAFFPIAAACLVFLVAIAYFNMRAELVLKPLVFIYAAAVLVVNLWGTIPLHLRPVQQFNVATGETGRMVGVITGKKFPIDPEWCAKQPNGCVSPTTGERLRPLKPEDELRQARKEEATTTKWNRAEADCVGLGTWTVPLQPNRRSGPICSPPRRQAPYGIEVAIERADPSIRLTYHLTLDGVERKVVHEPGENQHVAIGDFDILYISAEREVNVKIKLEATKPSA